jgi:Tfp pilus assembly PilM family ATPase
MPGKILGLDIHSKSLTAVQITSGLKGYQITSCAHILFKEGQGLEAVLAELTRELDLKSDLCISSLPVEYISFRNFSLPFRDTKKIRQILPYELEPLVPLPMNELIIDYQVSANDEQSNILAISARKSVIADHLSFLKSNEIDPEVLEVQPAPMLSWLISQDNTPENGLLLYLDSSRSTLSLYLNDRVVLIRPLSHKHGDNESISDQGTTGPSPASLTPEQIETWIRGLSREINKTIHAFKWQQNLTASPQKVFFTGPRALYKGMSDLLTRFLGLPAEPVNISQDPRLGMDAAISRTWKPALMDSALALALRDGRKGARFNLRKDEFEVQKPYLGIKKELHWLGMLLFFVLTFLIIDLAVDYYYLKGEYLTLKGRVEDIARDVLPNERLIDPKAQIEQKLSSITSGSEAIPGIRANERVLDLILDISERIPKNLDILVTRMVFDQETIRISGITDEFNSVDIVKSSLEPSKYFQEVTISSANLDKRGKQVKFELKLQRAK